jgi:hypothetical protein
VSFRRPPPFFDGAAPDRTAWICFNACSCRIESSWRACQSGRSISSSFSFLSRFRCTGLFTFDLLSFAYSLRSSSTFLESTVSMPKNGVRMSW